jgi:hypothetical protein
MTWIQIRALGIYTVKQRSTDMRYKLNVFNKVEEVATDRNRWREHIATVWKVVDRRSYHSVINLQDEGYEENQGGSKVRSLKPKQATRRTRKSPCPSVRRL